MADEDWAPFAGMAEGGSARLPNPAFPGLDVEWLKSKIPEYLASVKGVDRSVGRLLAVLRELGIADNTVVIFTSDHGYNMGHNGIWHKGNGHWRVKEDFLPDESSNLIGSEDPEIRQVISDYDLEIRARMKELNDPVLDKLGRSD